MADIPVLDVKGLARDERADENTNDNAHVQPIGSTSMMSSKPVTDGTPEDCPNGAVDEDLMRHKPAMNLFGGISVIVGSMIGAGIFFTPGPSCPTFLLNVTGSVGLNLLIWAACGILAMFGALCYAELGYIISMSGGRYYSILKAFGGVSDFFKWATLFVTKPTSQAVIALALGNYILRPFFASDCYIPQEVPIFAATCILVCSSLKPGYQSRQLKNRATRKVKLQPFDLEKCKEEVKRMDKELEAMRKSLPPDHEMIAALQEEFDQKSDQLIENLTKQQQEEEEKTQEVEEQKRQVEEQRQEVEDRLKAVEVEKGNEIQKVKKQRQEVEDRLKAVEVEKGNEIQKVKEQKRQVEEQRQEVEDRLKAVEVEKGNEIQRVKEQRQEVEEQKKEVEERLKAVEEESNIKGNEIQKVEDQKRQIEEQRQEVENQKKEVEERLKAVEEESNIKGNEIRKVEEQRQEVEERLKAVEEESNIKGNAKQVAERKVKKLERERDQMDEILQKEIKGNDDLIKYKNHLRKIVD